MMVNTSGFLRSLNAEAWRAVHDVVFATRMKLADANRYLMQRYLVV